MAGISLANDVLGESPRIISNTKESLELAKTDSLSKLKTLFQELHNDLLSQRAELYTTLKGLGIVYFPPDPELLEARMRDIHPKNHQVFVSIINEMVRIMEDLADKVKPDVDRKPDWRKDPLERARWGWDLIKRGFGTLDHREALDFLKNRNEALSYIFYKRALPFKSSYAAVIAKLQNRFSLEQCNRARNHALAIYRALECSWNFCPAAHQATFDLRWHYVDQNLVNRPFHLALSCDRQGCSSNGNGHNSSELWRKTSIWVVEGGKASKSESAEVSNIDDITRELPPPSAKATLGGKDSKKGKRDRSSHTSVQEKLAPHQSSSASNNMPQPAETSIGDLCKTIQTKHQVPSFEGLLPDPHNSQDRKVRLSFTQTTSDSSLKSVSLRSLLTPGKVSPLLRLTRKQHFGAAAAMAWAVLHLSGSSWLTEGWEMNEVRFPIEKDEDGHEVLSQTPFISHTFHKERVVATPQENQSQYGMEVSVQDGLVHNKILSALGVFLIELGLHLPFEKLREQYAGASTSQAIDMFSPLKDLDLAVELADRIYFDAGPAYANAIKRCLRCEFPGRDKGKHFGNDSFKQEFFNLVVAPVQATFDLTPYVEMDPRGQWGTS